MAIYREINEYRKTSHRCKADPDDKDLLPLTDCYACKQEARLVQVGDKSYVNSYPDSHVEQRTSGRVYAVTHEGLVMADRERNFSGDSDFYAVVWDPKEQRVAQSDYATTRFGGTDHNYVKVDIAEEHHPAMRLFYIKQTIAAIEETEREMWREAAEAALRPYKHERVEVVKGRKVPIGTVGFVIWFGENQWGEVIGLVPDGEKRPVWTAATNVKVLIDPDDLPYQDDFQTTPQEQWDKAESSVDANMARFTKKAKTV